MSLSTSSIAMETILSGINFIPLQWDKSMRALIIGVTWSDTVPEQRKQSMLSGLFATHMSQSYLAIDSH